MPGLGEYLNNALGLLNRVGPLGTTVPTQMRGMSLGGFLNSMNDTAQGVSRGMSADLLGAPVDIVSQLMTVPRFLGAPTPDFTQSPVGGSQWIGQKMENIGLLRQPTNSANEVAGRVIGGMLSSPGSVGRVGTTIENATMQAARNAANLGPSSISKEFGMFNTDGLTREQARALLSQKAEEFAAPLRSKGFDVQIEQSGSSAGPSFYATVFDPQTNRFIKMPARFSGHSKGPFNHQLVFDMSDDKALAEKIYAKAENMRNLGPVETQSQEVVDRIARLRAKNEARQAKRLERQ